MGPEEILAEFSHLDLARIHPALAYYHVNKAQIEADLAADEALYDELAAEYPHGWTREDRGRGAAPPNQLRLEKESGAYAATLAA